MAKKIAAAAAAPEVKPAVATDPGYTVNELAAEYGMEATNLRAALRTLGIEKPGSRWAWPKKTDAGLVEIRGQLKEHFAKAAAKEKEAPKGNAEVAAPKRKKGGAAATA